jgi:hypothetical protein
MSSKSRDRETYLKQLPETKKWLNECLICHSTGYKPELPEKIYPGLMAENIRSLFSPLDVNALSICNDCAKHWNETKIK